MEAESEKQKYPGKKEVNVCGKVVGERQEHLNQLYERRVVRKARVIVDDNSHVLAKYYELPSGRRFRVPISNTVGQHFSTDKSVQTSELCSLSFKIYNMCYTVYCDVVNVQPRLNFSDEIIQ